MRLKSFRVTNYKRVKDSGIVECHSPLTLVGQNEAGKTAILEALFKFQNSRDAKYDITTEWPRDARSDASETAPVVSCVLELSDAERQELSKITGSPCTLDSVTVTKRYNGNYLVAFKSGAFAEEFKSSDVVEAFSIFPEAAGDVRAAFQTAWSEVRKSLIESASKQKPPNAAIPIEKPLAKLRTVAAVPATSEQQAQVGVEQSLLGQIEAIVSQIQGSLGKLRSPAQLARNWIASHLPTFVYFDDYAAFVGTCNLSELLQRREADTLGDTDRTILTILDLAGLDLARLVALGSSASPGDKEQRRFDLDDAGKRLTKAVSKRWSQRDNVVEFSADGDIFTTYIRGKSDSFLTKLEERSKGFQWFFSFDLLFMKESDGTFKDCVLLLDEPGLHLHPMAQTDLLERIKSYAERNTVIFTTHLPFMIDLRSPENIRVVTDSGGATTVSDQLMSRDKGDRLVLSAAVGITTRQNYLVAERNLIVEGPDDFWILSRLSKLAQNDGRPHLDDDVRITPGPSASEAVPIAVFMSGQDLAVTCLFDSDTAGKTAKTKLEAYWSKQMPLNGKILMLGDVLDLAEHPATLEDLITEDFYVECVWTAYGDELSDAGKNRTDLKRRSSETVKNSMSRRVNEILGSDHFNSEKVMRVVKSKLLEANSLADISDALANNTDKLFNSISASWPNDVAEIDIKRARHASNSASNAKKVT